MSRAENTWDNWDGGDTVPRGLWDQRYARAMNGRTGLERLREMRSALAELPVKELCGDTLATEETTCFVGAIVARREAHRLGKPLGQIISELHAKMVWEYGEDGWEDLSTTAEEGQRVGLPWTVAWEWATLNDGDWSHLEPEERYRVAVEWVEDKIRQHPLVVGS